MKYVLIKLFDLGVIAALVFGNHSLQDFAVAAVGFFVFVAVLGPFVLTDESAREIAGRSIGKKLIRYLTLVGYVSALIYSQHPYWAAAYVMAYLWIMTAVTTRLKGAA